MTRRTKRLGRKLLADDGTLIFRRRKSNGNLELEYFPDSSTKRVIDYYFPNLRFVYPMYDQNFYTESDLREVYNRTSDSASFLEIWFKHLMR